MNKVVNKTVNLDCSQYLDYELVEAFISQAKREAWSDNEIASVINMAVEHFEDDFLTVIKLHCEQKEY